MKTCSRCKAEKELSEFGITHLGYTHSWCRDCRNEAHREYRARNRDKIIKKQREYYNSDKGRVVMLRSNLKKNYNVTVETYQELIASQDGECLICHKDLNGVGVANIDHDHATGIIRGVLCKACNRGLGMFKDDIQLLLKAVVYLNSFLPDPVPLALIERDWHNKSAVMHPVIRLAEALKEK